MKSAIIFALGIFLNLGLFAQQFNTPTTDYNINIYSGVSGFLDDNLIKARRAPHLGFDVEKKISKRFGIAMGLETFWQPGSSKITAVPHPDCNLVDTVQLGLGFGFHFGDSSGPSLNYHHTCYSHTELNKSFVALAPISFRFQGTRRLYGIMELKVAPMYSYSSVEKQYRYFPNTTDENHDFHVRAGGALGLGFHFTKNLSMVTKTNVLSIGKGGFGSISLAVNYRLFKGAEKHF